MDAQTKIDLAGATKGNVALRRILEGLFERVEASGSGAPAAPVTPDVSGLVERVETLERSKQGASSSRTRTRNEVKALEERVAALEAAGQSGG